MHLSSFGQIPFVMPFLRSVDVNWPSFGKGENKSQLIDIDSHLSDSVSIYWFDFVILHATKTSNRTIKTTISQQYTSFVFHFAETRSMIWRQLTERISGSYSVSGNGNWLMSERVRHRRPCQYHQTAFTDSGKAPQFFNSFFPIIFLRFFMCGRLNHFLSALTTR